MDELMAEVERLAKDRNDQVVRATAALIPIRRMRCGYRKAEQKKAALLKVYPEQPSMTSEYELWKYWRSICRKTGFKKPCWNCVACMVS